VQGSDGQLPGGDQLAAGPGADATPDEHGTSRSSGGAERPEPEAGADVLAPGELAAARPFGGGDELKRQEAFDVAWRFLAHRDRTEAEIRQNFVKKRVDPEFVEEVVAALLEGGYIDDAAFARRFAEDRRNLDAWGADRIERRLNELGVDRALIREVVAGGEHDELAAASELLVRRFPAPPETPRDRDRALAFLVRKGYDLELAYDALRRHAGASVEY